MRAAVYIRMSTDDQAGSPERQRAQVMPYCQRKGYEVVKVYEDLGMRGSDASRPEFQRMLQDAQKGQFDIIVVDEQSRLSRADTLDYMVSVAYGVDLRNKKAAAKPRLEKLARLLSKPAPAPVVKKIPETVGSAAELFLKVRRSEMAKDSFRVVPSKVRRFVEFIGADTACSSIEAKDWRLFVRSLRAEVTERKLEKTTARICHNRCREFLTWLVENGATDAFDFGGSAVQAMG